jgi:hypothetical protein
MTLPKSRSTRSLHGRRRLAIQPSTATVEHFEKRMASVDDMHRAFGDAAEAGQLLETHLGTMMLEHHVIIENLTVVKNPKRAKEVLDGINKHTLGQLLRRFHKAGPILKTLEAQLEHALEERNRLVHGFFRYHNLRRETPEGRDIMLKDLIGIHDTLLKAYTAVMLLDGIDLQATIKAGPTATPIIHEAQVNPKKRLPI